ncbi:hypothetical protein H2O64_16430 [Kordia sp. YSTF-M3]|uniref:Uncharacterized protein n=1 Tax=Kordia aestuariivivens TaxID=2759037 RepID=A0ABR7QCL6_9FLAO|nr:hypothetical protein [Kordia aestuariivivens]MBC8756262.1 hypothetical protein [Kordia aestuariivivens]
MSKSAIVVVRHACDGGTKPSPQTLPFNANIKFNNQGTYTKINADNSITIPINWLGGLGLKQAANLGVALPKLLKDYCPVSRIITEDVGNGHDGTSNPLHTISFYANNINKDQNISFDIFNGGAVPSPETFNVDTLLKDGKGKFSTVICWEAMGMWRQGSGTPYYKKSILGLLGHCGPNGEKVNNYNQIKENSPYKGQIIYIFECNDDSSLNLKIYNLDGTNFTDITGASHWPGNMCPKSEQHD